MDQLYQWDERDKSYNVYVDFIYRTIFYNINQLDNSIPHYKEIYLGGQLLWNEYFYCVYEGQESLQECILRLQKDFRTIEMNTIHKYVTRYGCPFLT